MMAAPDLTKIETDFARLSPDVQLSLLERLMHQARLNLMEKSISWEDDLRAMAVDPAIRREIQQIEAEFEVAEGDGLEKK